MWKNLPRHSSRISSEKPTKRSGPVPCLKMVHAARDAILHVYVRYDPEGIFKPHHDRANAKGGCIIIIWPLCTVCMSRRREGKNFHLSWMSAAMPTKKKTPTASVPLYISYKGHSNITDTAPCRTKTKDLFINVRFTHFTVFTVGVKSFFRPFEPRLEERKKVNFWKEPQRCPYTIINFLSSQNFHSLRAFSQFWEQGRIAGG